MAAETFTACLLGQEGSYLVPTIPFIVGKGNAGIVMLAKERHHDQLY